MCGAEETGAVDLIKQKRSIVQLAVRVPLHRTPLLLLQGYAFNAKFAVQILLTDCHTFPLMLVE